MARTPPKDCFCVSLFFIVCSLLFPRLFKVDVEKNNNNNNNKNKKRKQKWGVLDKDLQMIGFIVVYVFVFFGPGPSWTPPLDLLELPVASL